MATAAAQAQGSGENVKAAPVSPAKNGGNATENNLTKSLVNVVNEVGCESILHSNPGPLTFLLAGEGVICRYGPANGPTPSLYIVCLSDEGHQPDHSYHYC